MQTPTAPSPFRVPPVESPRAGGGNEFSVAVARLIERRGHVVVERPPILPRFDPAEEEVDAPRRWWMPRALVARGAALALSLVVAGIVLAWLVTGDASPPSATVSRPRPSPPAAALEPVAAPPAPLAESRPAMAAPPVLPDPAPAARPTPEPQPEPAPAAAAAVPSAPLGRDEVREVQSRLTALGFAAGPADGIAGPQTQAALRRYAESRRLPGRDLDRGLLQRLRAEPSRAR